MGVLNVKFWETVRGKLPAALGGTRLSAADQAQAQIMGMALAALKASQVNAHLLLQQAESLRKTQEAMLTTARIVGSFAHEGNSVTDSLNKYAAGSVEHEAMVLMADQLLEMASGLEKVNNK